VGYTALHTAVLRGDLAATRALVAAGANINARITKPAPMERFTDKWMVLPVAVVGLTPLQMAARYVEVPILRFLLAAGADRRVATDNGTTPLMDLAGVGLNRNGSTDRRGRSVDVALVTLQNKDDAPILDGARLLIETGADVNAANKNGDTALHGAAGLGMRRVYDLLVAAGADPDARNTRRQSPRLIIENGDTLLSPP
jgi:ankyrin repeat protein